jgi:hypothetical protein
MFTNNIAIILITRIFTSLAGIYETIKHTILSVYLLCKTVVLTFILSIKGAFIEGSSTLQQGLEELDIKAQEITESLKKIFQVK